MTIIAAWAACMLTTSVSRLPGDEVKAASEEKQVPPAWSKEPVTAWPQFVLTNEATFKGHTPLNGASAFLMLMPDDDVSLVTARHLIGAEGGVEPPVALTDFDMVLAKWEAYPRTRPEARLSVKGLAMNTLAGARQDWLLLHLKDPKGKLPATPLRPRVKRAEIGDVAYLIGVPYADAKSSQNVYKGKVTKRPTRNYFELEFEPPVKLAGFSGAPVVDADGYLLGMVTTAPKSTRGDGLQTACWCQDISVGYSLWKKPDKASFLNEECKVRLKLPADWKSEPSGTASIVTQANDPDLGASIILQAFSPVARKKDLDLKAWAEEMKKNHVGEKLDDRRETELSDVKIRGRKAVQYDVTGSMGGAGMQYRTIFFEHGDCFCSLLCRASKDKWSKAQPRFEEVFAAIE